MLTARLIITWKCLRNCPPCCNKYKKVIQTATKIQKLSELVDYDIICITGGEPMLEIQRTVDIITQIKKQNPKVIIYLYTAWYAKDVERIISLIDGIHFTIHENETSEDIKEFNKFQRIIANYDKSFRLYIDRRVQTPVTIQPNLWARVEIFDWLSEEECLLRIKHEKLLVYENEEIR
jgi:organic radical activating enzyme